MKKYGTLSKTTIRINGNNVIIYLLPDKSIDSETACLFIRFDIDKKPDNPHIWGTILNNITHLAKKRAGKLKIKDLYLSVENQKQAKFCRIFIKKNNLFNGAIFSGNFKGFYKHAFKDAKTQVL